MKHYIIAKFKENIDWKSHLEEITKLFEASTKVDGVLDIKIFPSNSELSNRSHVMIELQLTPEGLENFDNSPIHSEWKRRFGDMLEGKTIFDCD